MTACSSGVGKAAAGLLLELGSEVIGDRDKADKYFRQQVHVVVAMDLFYGATPPVSLVDIFVRLQ